MGQRDISAFVSIEDAAAWLGVSVEQMLAWNMVAVLTVSDEYVVPRWSINPAIARYMPMLSEVFQGEALVYCLTHMRPFHDDRSGIDALRTGEWPAVLDMLRDYRRRFDQVLQEDEESTPGLLAQAPAEVPSFVLH